MSVIVLSCFFAAISMFKNSKKYDGSDAATFCHEICKILTQVLKADRQIIQSNEFKEPAFIQKLNSK